MFYKKGILKSLWHRCFQVNFAKSLRITFSRTPPGDGSYSTSNPTPSTPYSSSYNLRSPPSRALIGGRHLNFCSLTSSMRCNLPRKRTPVKHEARQKNWVSNCHIDNLPRTPAPGHNSSPYFDPNPLGWVFSRGIFPELKFPNSF